MKSGTNAYVGMVRSKFAPPNFFSENPRSRALLDEASDLPAA